MIVCFIKEVHASFLSNVTKMIYVYCAVDGGLSTWSSWSQCTLSCNGGTRSRTRSCTNPAPAGNGKDCSALGDKLETESCNDNPCKGLYVNYFWGKLK